MSSNQIINQIQNSLDIADIIGEHVKLRKTSRGFMGLCPFHQEDTPSFHVYTDTQSYYCFGCHQGGTIFTYVMRTENVDFRDALRILADRAGIKLGTYQHEGSDTFDVLNLAAKFFTDNLKGPQGTAARAYMSRRQLDGSDITRYSLGYSLNSWDSLTRYLNSKGIKDKAVIDSGLALTNSYGLYDRFRGRLMFPIRDITGKVIAFGGRLIDGEGAKYINSPESQAYSKRRNLYLLNEARSSIREKGRSILVEGYMDALRLNKCGFSEAVASLGTSLTPEQAAMLSRYADRCYICYDSDTAGQAAAVKGMYTLAENGLSVYVVNIPEGKDPDEFLCSNSPDSFEEALHNAQPLVIKHVQSLREALNNERTRRAALTELFDGLSRLNIDDVLKHMGTLSQATMLPASVIERSLIERKPPSPQNIKPRVQTQTQPNNSLDDTEAAMCWLLWNNQSCRLSVDPDEVTSLISGELARECAQAILSEDTGELYELWQGSGDTAKLGLLKRGELYCETFRNMDDSEKFVSIHRALKAEDIERRIKAIRSMPPEKRDLNEFARLYRERSKYYCR